MHRRKWNQISIYDNPAMFGGLQLNSDNKWVKLAKMIPWWAFGESYAALFSENPEEILSKDKGHHDDDEDSGKTEERPSAQRGDADSGRNVRVAGDTVSHRHITSERSATELRRDYRHTA